MFKSEEDALVSWARAIEKYMSIGIKLELEKFELCQEMIVSASFEIVQNDDQELLVYSELNEACFHTGMPFKRGRRYWWVSSRKEKRLLLLLYPYYRLDGKEDDIERHANPDN